MSWTYLRLMLLDSVNAPTLWFGLGLGLLGVGVVLMLWDRDRRRQDKRRRLDALTARRADDLAIRFPWMCDRGHLTGLAAGWHYTGTEAVPTCPTCELVDVGLGLLAGDWWRRGVFGEGEPEMTEIEVCGWEWEDRLRAAVVALGGRP